LQKDIKAVGSRWHERLFSAIHEGMSVMTEVEKNCPDYSLETGGHSASELIEKLKEAMPTDGQKDELLKLLAEHKSTPEDLEQAYMDIPQIVSYYAQVRDEIDGQNFSAFGSLDTNKNLLDEVKTCTKDLNPKIKRTIDSLFWVDYPKKQQGLEENRKQATEESERLLSCVEIAEKALARRKHAFCNISGSSLKYLERDETGNDTEKEKELSYCKEDGDASGDNPSKLPPPGASARVHWASTELVRLFKAVGITEERGKKSNIPCDSLSVPPILIYAYSLEIGKVIKDLSDAEDKTDSQFKKDLDKAWKEWLAATYEYMNQYVLDKDNKAALAKAGTELKDFLENREGKFLRDAQDVEAEDEDPCD
jgi:hypothetical protein